MTRLVAIFCLVMACGLLAGQSGVPKIGEPQGRTPESFAAFPSFTLTAGKHDKQFLPTTAATICVMGQKDLCYAMPPGTGDDGKTVYQFGMNPHSESLTLPGGGAKSNGLLRDSPVFCCRTL